MLLPCTFKNYPPSGAHNYISCNTPQETYMLPWTSTDSFGTTADSPYHCNSAVKRNNKSPQNSPVL